MNKQHDIIMDALNEAKLRNKEKALFFYRIENGTVNHAEYKQETGTIQECVSKLHYGDIFNEIEVQRLFNVINEIK